MSDDSAAQVPCQHCGERFRPKPRVKGTFCSRRCWYDYLAASKPMTTCERCGTPFRMKSAVLRQGGGKYCSKSCSVPALAEARTRNLADRFWGKVRKAPDGGCWEWTGYKDTNGYGRIMAKRDDGRHSPMLTHRLSWELVRGPIPEGMGVLHDCPGGDNPSCCNPTHLFLGDQLDNMRDCAAKGRTTRGEQIPNAKLTEEQVIEVRRRYAAGDTTYAALADVFQTAPATIADIVMRRTWKHIN